MIPVAFNGRQSVKHLIESLGVPHTEAGIVLINGKEGQLSEIAVDSSSIFVNSADSIPPVEPRFVLDGHLGRLAAHLRMLGFDCLYRPEYEDSHLARLAQEDRRILLTRDRRLLMRKSVEYGYCPRSLDPRQQLVEVVKRYGLAGKIAPFFRCIRCNQRLVHVSKDVIQDRLEPLTKKYFNEFRICPDCQQIYWKGSHLGRMEAMVRQFVKNDISL